MNEQELKLQQEIISEAKTKAERIVARARNDADAVIAASREAAEKKHQERLAEARETAAKDARTLLSGIDMEIARRWLLRQEQCIDDVLRQALQDAEATTGDARRQALEGLAREAFAALGDGPCTVRVGQADQAIVTAEWCALQARAVFPESTAAFTVQVDDALAGGLVITTVDGRKSFDNTFARRLARMHDELRLLLVNG